MTDNKALFDEEISEDMPDGDLQESAASAPENAGLPEEDMFLDEEHVGRELEKRLIKAKKILDDDDKVERFLQRLEKKLKVVPLVGERLADIPVLVSLVRSFIKKDYTDIPIGSVLAIISALLYFLSPIDVVPDSIPMLGYFDDASVVAVCWKLVESDVVEYNRWRESHGRMLDV